MLAGFVAANVGLQIAFAEQAICLSVILLGVLVALRVRAPVWQGAVIVGLFAFFHGHAHGTEASAAKLIPYAAGFVLGTAALLAVGITAGLCVKALAAYSGWVRGSGRIVSIGRLT
jgi:urease accessory protein